MEQRTGARGHAAPSPETAPPGVDDAQDLYGNEFLRAQARAPSSDAVAHVNGLANEVEAASGDGSKPSPRVVDGDAGQIAVIIQAVDEARVMGERGLQLLSRGPSNEREEELFAYHFGSIEPKVLATATSRLSASVSGLNGPVPVQVESWMLPGMEDTAAYVWGGPLAGQSDIHVTPKFFDLSVTDQAWTLVHEATHKWAGTGDHAYVHDAHYSSLSWDQAIDNADSYAAFSAGRQGQVEEDERSDREREEQLAADTHSGMIWEAWESGAITLWADGFTTADGVEIRKEIVARTVFAWFREQRKADYAEVAAAVAGGQQEGPFACTSGLVVREDLFQEVWVAEGDW